MSGNCQLAIHCDAGLPDAWLPACCASNLSINGCSCADNADVWLLFRWCCASNIHPVTLWYASVINVIMDAELLQLGADMPKSCIALGACVSRRSATDL
jgi:hypothetical protein